MQTHLAMKNLFHGNRQASVLAIAVVAMVPALLAALPAGASAANTLSLSLEPAIPKQGQPFQFIARGTADHPGTHSAVDLGFAPGSGTCASNSALEQENPNGMMYGDFGL